MEGMPILRQLDSGPGNPDHDRGSAGDSPGKGGRHRKTPDLEVTRPQQKWPGVFDDLDAWVWQ